MGMGKNYTLAAKRPKKQIWGPHMWFTQRSQWKVAPSVLYTLHFDPFDLDTLHGDPFDLYPLDLDPSPLDKWDFHPLDLDPWDLDPLD